MIFVAFDQMNKFIYALFHLVKCIPHFMNIIECSRNLMFHSHTFTRCFFNITFSLHTYSQIQTIRNYVGGYIDAPAVRIDARPQIRYPAVRIHTIMHEYVELEDIFSRFIASDDAYNTSTKFIGITFIWALLLFIPLVLTTPHDRKKYFPAYGVLISLVAILLMTFWMPTNEKIVKEFESMNTPYSCFMRGKNFRLCPLDEHTTQLMDQYLHQYTINVYSSNHNVILMHIQSALHKYLNGGINARVERSDKVANIKKVILKIAENINTYAPNQELARLIDLMMVCYISTDDWSVLELVKMVNVFGDTSRKWMSYYTRREKNKSYQDGNIVNLSNE